MQQFDTVTGVFSPKNMQTLRPEAVKHIGRKCEWFVAWMIDEGDSNEYAGQFALQPKDPDIMLAFIWTPECDVVIDNTIPSGVK